MLESLAEIGQLRVFSTGSLVELREISVITHRLSYITISEHTFLTVCLKLQFSSFF
jgi:hypothetical protein